MCCDWMMIFVPPPHLSPPHTRKWAQARPWPPGQIVPPAGVRRQGHGGRPVPRPMAPATHPTFSRVAALCVLGIGGGGLRPLRTRRPAHATIIPAAWRPQAGGVVACAARHARSHGESGCKWVGGARGLAFWSKAGRCSRAQGAQGARGAPPRCFPHPDGFCTRRKEGKGVHTHKRSTRAASRVPSWARGGGCRGAAQLCAFGGLLPAFQGPTPKHHTLACTPSSSISGDAMHFPPHATPWWGHGPLLHRPPSTSTWPFCPAA